MRHAHRVRQEGARRPDKVDSNSITNLLRDKDMDAANVKRLADSLVSKPKLDRDVTDEALSGDQD